MSAWIWGEIRSQRARKRRWLGVAASVLVTGTLSVLALTRAPELEWKPWSFRAGGQGPRRRTGPSSSTFTADWCATVRSTCGRASIIKSVRKKAWRDQGRHAGGVISPRRTNDRQGAREIRVAAAVPLCWCMPRGSQQTADHSAGTVPLQEESCSTRWTKPFTKRLRSFSRGRAALPRAAHFLESYGGREDSTGCCIFG